MTAVINEQPPPDPFEATQVIDAPEPLRSFNEIGVLAAADVQVALQASGAAHRHERGRAHGREVLYRIEEDRLDQAANAMVELARHWDRRLDRIKRLSEAAHARNKERSRERNGDQP